MTNAEIAKQLQDLKRANTNTLIFTSFLFLSTIGQRMMLTDLTKGIGRGVVEPEIIEGTAEEIS